MRALVCELGHPGRIESHLTGYVRIFRYFKYINEFLTNNRTENIKSRDDVFISDLADIVMKNLDDPSFNVLRMGQEIGLSQSQLFRKLKALTDQRPNEFIRTLRMKKAAELLTRKYGNVSEIAYAVGYNSLSYFSSSFKETFGKSPHDYVSH